VLIAPALGPPGRRESLRLSQGWPSSSPAAAVAVGGKVVRAVAEHVCAETVSVAFTCGTGSSPGRTRSSRP
jgi:hypothetical protein